MDVESGRGEEYPMSDILEMCGRSKSHVMIFCENSKTEHLRKFLFDPLPVESHLNHVLHDHFNGEIVARNITSKQDAVDYLTWTLMYRRMTQNPNYYNLQGLSHRQLSDHLSELVESVFCDLEQSKCIAIDEDEVSCSPLNLGMIASYYYVNYRTIELFSKSLSSKTKIRALLDVIGNAAEFESLPFRHREDILLKQIAARITHLSHSSANKSKSNVLIHAHLARLSLPAELAKDSTTVVLTALRLTHASVDVMSSNGWLLPALAAMEISQMLTQAMWANESPLKQIPHFSNTKLVEEFEARGIKNVFDLMEMDDAERAHILSKRLTGQQVASVAQFCNQYPNLDVSFTLVTDAGEWKSGGEDDDDEENDENVCCSRNESNKITVKVNIERDEDESPVIAPYFPKQKNNEAYWIVVGETSTNSLLAIKRINLRKKASVSLDINDIPLQHKKELKIFVMSDSYMGCDQEFRFLVNNHTSEK